MSDVQKAIASLLTLVMPEYLNYEMLIFNLIMLVALISPTRAHETCSLNIDFLVKYSSHYTFHFSNITKTTSKGKLSLLSFLIKIFVHVITT